MAGSACLGAESDRLPKVLAAEPGWTSIGEPLLYLLGLGFGLGTLVGIVRGQRYVEFVAPGMVMSSAMFATAYECT